MEEILHTLNINDTFFFYLINFLILLVILKLILWKPLTKAINERQNKIEKGLKLTEDLEVKMQKLEKDYEDKIKQASIESKEILEKAKILGEENVKKALEGAKKESDKMIEATKAQLKLEKQKLHDELMAETKDIVINAVEKIIKQELDNKTKEKIVSEFIKKI